LISQRISQFNLPSQSPARLTLCKKQKKSRFTSRSVSFYVKVSLLSHFLSFIFFSGSQSLAYFRILCGVVRRYVDQLSRSRTAAHSRPSAQLETSPATAWVCQELYDVSEEHGTAHSASRRVLPACWLHALLFLVFALEFPAVSRATFYRAVAYAMARYNIEVAKSVGHQPKCDFCIAFHHLLLSLRALGDKAQINTLRAVHKLHCDYIAVERAHIAALGANVQQSGGVFCLTDRPSNMMLPHCGQGQLPKSLAHAATIQVAVQGCLVDGNLALYTCPKVVAGMGANFTAQAILDAILLGTIWAPLGDYCPVSQPRPAVTSVISGRALVIVCDNTVAQNKAKSFVLALALSLVMPSSRYSQIVVVYQLEVCP